MLYRFSQVFWFTIFLNYDFCQNPDLLDSCIISHDCDGSGGQTRNYWDLGILDPENIYQNN